MYRNIFLFICFFSLLVLIFFIYYFNDQFIYLTKVNELNFLQEIDKKNTIKGKEKYIQYLCLDGHLCGGWGDRLKSLLSTYAFSLITGRKFVMQVRKSCDLRTILEPNEINWNHEQLPANVSSANINIGCDFAYFHLFKSDLSIFDKMKDETLINISSCIMFGNALRENKNVKKRIEELGYDQSKFHISYQIHKWYKQLFKLNQRLQKQYDLILKRLKPNENTKVICAQIRKGDDGQLHHRDNNTEKDYWSFVKNNFLNSTNISYSIYITSDREYLKQEAKDIFVNNNVVFIENSSVHIDHTIFKSDECQEMEKVMLDFHVMQNCDIGLVGYSGFGVLALWNRPDPFKDLYVYARPYDTSKLKPEDWEAYVTSFKNLSFIRYSKLGDVFFPP